MSQILVTGGTGTLGRIIVDELVAKSQSPRVLSRRAHTAGTTLPTWVVGDLRSGVGIEDAVDGVDTIIHCASGRGDVEAARNLMRTANKSNCSHVVFISIVGVDSIPLGYYRSKLEAEKVIANSGLPFTIVRSTQFHNLIARALGTIARLPVMPVPAQTRFQPIDVSEVATRLIDLASGAPAGRVADMGGPEIRSTKDLANSYLRARRIRRFIVAIPIPGRAFAGFRQGANLTPTHAVGNLSFDEFLAVAYRKA